MCALHEFGDLSSRIVPIPCRSGELLSVGTALLALAKPLRRGSMGAQWEGHSAGWVVVCGGAGDLGREGDLEKIKKTRLNSHKILLRHEDTLSNVLHEVGVGVSTAY